MAGMSDISKIIRLLAGVLKARYDRTVQAAGRQGCLCLDTMEAFYV